MIFPPIDFDAGSGFSVNEKRNHLDHTDFVMAADFAMLQLQNELIDRWGGKSKLATATLSTTS